MNSDKAYYEYAQRALEDIQDKVTKAKKSGKAKDENGEEQSLEYWEQKEWEMNQELLTA
jgi:hypothetical protein